jgi:HEAT repeat protein
LIAALDDESLAAGKAAAEALGKLGPAAASAVPKLARILREHTDTRCEKIIEALEKIGPTPEGISSLIAAAMRRMTNHSQWYAAVTALRKLADVECIPTFLAALARMEKQIALFNKEKPSYVRNVSEDVRNCGSHCYGDSAA